MVRLVTEHCKLISITPDAEDQILYCARVSSDQGNNSTKLLTYLIKHKHWSPFEMAHAVFEINTSRAMSAQILRHRSFSFQEYSQRYAEAHEFVRYDARRQAEKNRQSSTDDIDDSVQRLWLILYEDVVVASEKAYKQALDLGIARESARFLLPMSVGTKLYMSGTIRSWIHYIDLRATEDTQLEHRQLAIEIRNMLAMKLPHIADALEWPIP